jgi:rod shape-determining protein MreB
MGLQAGDTAVDLGTADTLIHVRGRGVVLNEPSIVALSRCTGRILAVGVQAQVLAGRSPEDTVIVHPMRGGVISDFQLAGRMLRRFLHSVHGWRQYTRPRIAVAVPYSSSGVERAAIEDAVYAAGARKVYPIEAPLAAAIGAGLDVSSPIATFIADLGAGSTDAAIVAVGGLVTAYSTRVGGEDLTRALSTYVRREHGILLGAHDGDELKIAVGAPGPRQGEPLTVQGRGEDDGLPRTVEVPAAELREVVATPIRAVAATIHAVLDECPPELAADLVDAGMTLTGGGALLPGMDRLITAETGVRACLAPRPFDSVVLGTAAYLAEMGTWSRTVRREQAALR